MRTEGLLGLGVVIAVAVAAVVALPASAEAQGWLADRSEGQSPGFRIGDFVLHPGLGVEVGYDSNLYYSEDGAGALYQDSGILRATAHLLFSTRGSAAVGATSAAAGEGTETADAGLPDVSFVGGLSGSFFTFFNDINRSNMELDANLALTILPGRSFSVTINEAFGRSVRPFTENTEPRASYARIHNVAGVLFNLATTGQVLNIGVGYSFGLNLFEDSLFQYGNRFDHALSLQETFRFLPQTAIVHQTTFTIADYFNEGIAGSTLVNDGFMLSSTVGLNGAFTNEFSVLAAAGYGAGFFNATGTYDQEYESVIVQIQARWQIERASNLTFGYDRGFQPSYVGNWYRQDRGSAAFTTVIAGFNLGVRASFGYYEFGAIVEPDGVTPVGTTLQRGDYRLTASIFAEYRITDWLGVNGTLGYTGNFTDYSYIVDTTGVPPTFTDPAQFNKFEAWLGVRVFY